MRLFPFVICLISGSLSSAALAGATRPADHNHDGYRAVTVGDVQVVPVPPGVGDDVPEGMDPAVKPPPAQVPPAAAEGEEAPADSDKTTADDAADRLDKLFAQLAEAKSERARERVAMMIQVEWASSGSPTVDLLMLRAHTAMQNKDPALALDLLDGVVRFKPDFAAGWNRRAAASFMTGNYGKALVDLERTLALEPRHWGALTGLAAIQQSLGDEKAALATYKRILEIYPDMEKATEAVETLTAKTAGRTL